MVRFSGLVPPKRLRARFSLWTGHLRTIAGASRDRPLIFLTRVEQSCPGDGFRKGSDLAKHDFDDMADGVGWILGSAGSFQATVDEQLEKVERQRPDE